MGFCTLATDYVRGGYTQVDNIFLSSYLPAASGDDVKVYFYGLYLAGGAGDNSNTLEKIALDLRLPEEKVLSAFRYFENLGLVTVKKGAELSIAYRSVKTPETPVIKYNAADYAVFIEEMARVFPDKILSENELMGYIEIMHRYSIDTNAMLMIATYCTEIKAVVSTPYILAVASDWGSRGICTEDAVNAHIEELENNNEDLRQIFKTLGLRSKPGLDDRQAFLKWSKEYGYRLDAILAAARLCKKRGGMERLEIIIEELRLAGANTAAEIAAYGKTKEETLTLARDIVSAIGGYYSSYDAAIDVFVNPWLIKGFEPRALLSIAKLCFIKNIKTLDGMDKMVCNFYRLGILTEKAVTAYIERQVATDNFIKEVLIHTGSDSFVSNKDREFYKTFAETWGFSHDMILLAADNSYGKPFPMTNINRILAKFKERGINSVADGAALLAEETPRKKPSAKSSATTEYISHNYTKEQLNSVFSSPDDILGGISDV